MTTLDEIKAAIEKLPYSQQHDLHGFLRDLLRTRPRVLSPEEAQAWLEKARGVSVSGMTTDEMMAMTRGEE